MRGTGVETHSSREALSIIKISILATLYSRRDVNVLRLVISSSVGLHLSRGRGGVQTAWRSVARTVGIGNRRKNHSRRLKFKLDGKKLIWKHSNLCNKWIPHVSCFSGKYLANNIFRRTFNYRKNTLLENLSLCCPIVAHYIIELAMCGKTEFRAGIVWNGSLVLLCTDAYIFSNVLKIMTPSTNLRCDFPSSLRSLRQRRHRCGAW